MTPTTYQILYPERRAAQYIEQLVRAKMDETGLSQASLARSSGMENPHLTMYQKGVTHPGKTNRARLARHFGADLELLEELITDDRLVRWMAKHGKSIQETAASVSRLRRLRRVPAGKRKVG